MSGSSSQSITLPIVAAVFVMRGDRDGDPAAGDPAGGDETAAATSDAGERRANGAGAGHPGDPERPPAPTVGAIAIESDDDQPDPGPDVAPETQVAPGTLPADPRFGPQITEMTTWVSEDGYGQAPTPTLQSRFDRVIAGMETGRQVSLAGVGCKAGGGDCRLVGTAPTPIDIHTFAEGVEQSAPEGDEQLPTVSIEETHSSSSGETRFKMGVYYP